MLSFAIILWKMFSTKFDKDYFIDYFIDLSTQRNRFGAIDPPLFRQTQPRSTRVESSPRLKHVIQTKPQRK